MEIHQCCPSPLGRTCQINFRLSPRPVEVICEFECIRFATALCAPAESCASTESHHYVCALFNASGIAPSSPKL